ncbi:hypothetical protein NQ314_012089 [Rhamnusium bicolor]|uniref:Uncharacterized protein n=1 Tax=Rhamnusium bicolor TaxID=1586634 RepID=A0AAV8XDA5_9CUCU|nr:hypothetical protein NQ314_012089 [Rhamnusium bicolor]
MKSNTREESTEKTRLQQPVKLQPSWEENNLPEDELNFKNLTMDEASLQLNTPPDRYNLVYMTFLIHGIGVLMPWNMFITAIDVSNKTVFRLFTSCYNNIQK